MTSKGVVPARGLSDSWDTYREELQASQVIGGGEIPDESLQRFIKMDGVTLLRTVIFV